MHQIFVMDMIKVIITRFAFYRLKLSCHYAQFKFQLIGTVRYFYGICPHSFLFAVKKAVRLGSIIVIPSLFTMYMILFIININSAHVGCQGLYETPFCIMYLVCGGYHFIYFIILLFLLSFYCLIFITVLVYFANIKIFINFNIY